MARWVKDPVLMQLWHRSHLQLGFFPWFGNFHMLQVQQKKKKKIIRGVPVVAQQK